MKVKTIKKILNSKIEAWVDSVKDENVKQAIRKNAIVTGGSIASMLLQEKVNDYDVYFKTKEAVKLVAEYYANHESVKGKVEVFDGKNKESLTREFKDGPFKEESKAQWDVFVRSLTEDRIKIYIKGVNYLNVKGDKKAESDEDVQVDDKPEEKGENKFEPLYFTANAITLSDKVQVVIRFYGEAEEIHKNYDFVHATNYYDFSKNELVLRNEAMESLLSKELKYIGSLYPITSVVRMKKFLNRGWSITAGTMLKICYQISELDLKDVQVLEEQLVGVDIAYFCLLIEALRKVEDKTKINYNYISEIIERIFND